MFKKLRNAIARRRDMRLRKWCVKHAKDPLEAESGYWFIMGHYCLDPKSRTEIKGVWKAKEDGGWA